MRKDGYVVVQPWMVTDYNLNGNKLLIYALIWGFSQDDQSCFYINWIKRCNNFYFIL